MQLLYIIRLVMFPLWFGILIILYFLLIVKTNIFYYCMYVYMYNTIVLNVCAYVSIIHLNTIIS